MDDIDKHIKTLKLNGFTATCPKCKTHKIEDQSIQRVKYLLGAHLLNCKGVKE